MIDYDDYRDPESMESSYIGCTIALIGLAICLLLGLMFTACTTTKYVPVETVRTEFKTVRDSFIQKDSIFLKDSVFIRSKGDTVWYEKWHTKYVDRWRDRVLTDSFIKVDSVQVPYPVEKKLTKWQQTKIDWGGEAIVMLIVILFIIVWLIVKRYLNLRR